MELHPHADLTFIFGGNAPPKVSVSVGVGPGSTGLDKAVAAGVEAAALDLVKPLAADELQRISDSILGVTR